MPSSLSSALALTTLVEAKRYCSTKPGNRIDGKIALDTVALSCESRKPGPNGKYIAWPEPGSFELVDVENPYRYTQDFIVSAYQHF